MPRNVAEWNAQAGCYVFERGGDLWRLDTGWSAEFAFRHTVARVDGAEIERAGESGWAVYPPLPFMDGALPWARGRKREDRIRSPRGGYRLFRSPAAAQAWLDAEYPWRPDDAVRPSPALVGGPPRTTG